MKNKTIKILGIGAVVLLLLITLVPISMASNSGPDYKNRELLRIEWRQCDPSIYGAKWMCTSYFSDGWAMTYFYNNKYQIPIYSIEWKWKFNTFHIISPIGLLDTSVNCVNIYDI